MIPFTGYEEQRVRQMVEDISYYNAKHYFEFG
jgi:glucuronate isomerase